MKKVFITLMFVAANLLHSQNFEGTIKFKVTAENMNMTAQYFLKDDSYKMKILEMSGEGLSNQTDLNSEIIFNFNKKIIYVIIPSQKMYMEMDLKQMEKMQAEQYKNNKAKIDIKKTGEKKKILGYNCEKIIITTDEGVIETWMTRDIKFAFANMNQIIQGINSTELDKYSKELGYPMILNFTDKDGKSVKLETTEITPQKLDNSIFQLPAGYTKFNMPTMPGNIPAE